MSADMARRSYATQPQRPSPRPAPLSNDNRRPTPDAADAAANDLFEKNAVRFIAPTDKIPALLHPSEIPGLRAKYTTGQGRLDYLTKLASARLDFYYEQRGVAPFDPLTPEQDADARQFFGKYGMALKGDKPTAPPNSIKAREQAAQSVRPDRAAGATPAAPPAAAAPAREEPKPAPASPVENKPAPAADQAALLAEVKGLRGDVAGLRQVLELIAAQLAQPPAHVASAPSAAAPAPVTYELGEGEAFRDFWMESVKVGADDKTGAPTYKAVGHPYTQFGIRIWPEILPDLSIDPATLKPGVNSLPARLRVRAVIDAEGKPRKVVGLAS